MGFRSRWKCLWVSGLLLVSVAGAIECGRRYWNARWEAEAGPLIEAVQGLSSLVTLRVTVRDVLVTDIHGYTGGVTAVLVVGGEVEWATDVVAARLEQINSVSRTVTVVLPPPTLHAVRIDTAKTKIATLTVHGLWIVVPGSEAEKAVVNRAYVSAEQAVRSAGEGASFGIEAQRRTERLLDSVGRDQGWKVRVQWLEPVQR